MKLPAASPKDFTVEPSVLQFNCSSEIFCLEYPEEGDLLARQSMSKLPFGPFFSHFT